MKHAGMAVVMFAVWMLWSGHYSIDHQLVLGLGIFSCLYVVYISARKGLLDEEGHPLSLAGRMLPYIPWLIWAIVKANIDVAKRVLNPRLPIDPRLVCVKATQKSDVGRVIFANSITLTPGTVSVSLHEDEILVHALTREAADDVASGDMDRRVTALEG